MLYIIGNDYENWDFICLNFLISEVGFRKTLNLQSSKEYQNNSSTNPIFMSEIDIKKPIYLKEETYNFTLYENKVSVFFTDHNKQNYINTLLPYKTIINHTKIKVKNPFVFNFNFKEMITLAKIYLKWNLSKFFRKIININYKRKTITLDKQYLEKIDDGFLNFTIPYEEIVEVANQNIDLVIK